jgi:ABC-type nitrate/sulfonate/bicarbonate transport system substrate-binding protein
MLKFAATGKESTLVRVAIPDMISPSYFPAIAAVELGYFRDEGIDATLELLYPVTKTYEALREGRLDFVGGAAHAPLYAFPDWKGCKLLAALAQNMYWFLVVRRDLVEKTRAKRGDLSVVRGLRIGAAPGPVDGLKRMLRDVGMDPERDVQIGPVPGWAAAGVSFGLMAAQALEDGKLDGFWANGMGAEVAVRRGVGAVVLDARRGDGPAGAEHYTFPALVTSERWIDEHPETVAGAVRAVARAQAALRADPSLATRAAKAFPDAERALIAGLIARDAPFYDPAISEASARALNDFARSLGILRADARYEDVVAVRFRDAWRT